MADPISPIDYLLIGHLTADIAPGTRTAGGTVTYAARTAHAFGLQVGLVTSTAVDEPLLDVVRPYTQIVHIPAAHTTTFENIYTPDGRVQYVRGVAAPITPNDVPATWRDAPLVHMAPIAGEGNDPALLRLFPDATRMATLQGWLRRWGDDGRVYFKRWHDPAMIAMLDMIVFSEEDIVESPGLEAELAAETRHLVVTQAERGGLHYHHGTATRYRTPQVEIVHPTGAGDVFAAGLLAALHICDGDWDKALTVAATLGAETVTREGLHSAPSPARVAALLTAG